MIDYFSSLPNEKKTELFHDVVSSICEFFYSERYSFLHGLGMPNEEILERGYLTEAGMLAGGAEIPHLRNNNLKLRDILQYTLADEIFLVHSQGGTPVLLSRIGRLTRNEQSYFSDLTEAHICGSRAGEDGIEIVVDGIDPECIEKLEAALAAHEINLEMKM